MVERLRDSLSVSYMIMGDRIGVFNLSVDAFEYFTRFDRDDRCTLVFQTGR